MQDGLASLAGPIGEIDIVDFDWEAFDPAKRNGGKASFAVIDACTEISGKIVAKSAFVSGKIDGEIFAETVTIEKTGEVRGVIVCKTLIIHGQANARVICDHLQLLTGATLVSNLKYNTLNIASGASIIAAFECRLSQTATRTPEASDDPWTQEVEHLQAAWNNGVARAGAYLSDIAARARAQIKLRRK